MHTSTIEKYNLKETFHAIGESEINNVKVYEYGGGIFLARCDVFGTPVTDIIVVFKPGVGYFVICEELLNGMPVSEFDWILSRMKQNATA